MITGAGRQTTGLLYRVYRLSGFLMQRPKQHDAVNTSTEPSDNKRNFNFKKGHYSKNNPNAGVKEVKNKQDFVHKLTQPLSLQIDDLEVQKDIFYIDKCTYLFSKLTPHSTHLSKLITLFSKNLVHNSSASLSLKEFQTTMKLRAHLSNLFQSICLNIKKFDNKVLLCDIFDLFLLHRLVPSEMIKESTILFATRFAELSKTGDSGDVREDPRLVANLLDNLGIYAPEEIQHFMNLLSPKTIHNLEQQQSFYQAKIIAALVLDPSNRSHFEGIIEGQLKSLSQLLMIQSHQALNYLMMAERRFGVPVGKKQTQLLKKIQSMTDSLISKLISNPPEGSDIIDTIISYRLLAERLGNPTNPQPYLIAFNVINSQTFIRPHWHQIIHKTTLFPIPPFKRRLHENLEPAIKKHLDYKFGLLSEVVSLEEADRVVNWLNSLFGYKHECYSLPKENIELLQELIRLEEETGKLNKERLELIRSKASQALEQGKDVNYVKIIEDDQKKLFGV